jgi:hypothetical protein
MKMNIVAPHFPAIRNNSLIAEEKEGILLSMSQCRLRLSYGSQYKQS